MENLKKLLFNPFEEIAGYKALFIGVFLIVLTGISGYFAGVVFDGVLDMHFVENKLSIAASIIEGLVNWLSLSIILIIFGFLFSKTKFRLIDVLGTQALARWPYFILAIFVLVVPFDAVNQYIKWKYLGVGEQVIPMIGEIILFILFIIISIALLVLMVVLMYKAYSVSCNIKGTKGVVSFIGALLLAEIVSKIVHDFLYKNVG